MSSLPLQPKSAYFLDFPMKNVVKICGIPMSSLGGVHLVSGIAQRDAAHRKGGLCGCGFFLDIDENIQKYYRKQ